ncbi:MAG: hypothetical protein QXP42_02340 [Candidatus Micrarchaeia archaeon]
MEITFTREDEEELKMLERKIAKALEILASSKFLEVEITVI